MKLLIIEDSSKHQAAARVQLPEATVVNYDEAYELLRDARPGDYAAILTDLHFKTEESRSLPAMPFGPKWGNNNEAVGKEFPFGLAFVLKGVELNTPVALVSDGNHHNDLIIAMLDIMGHIVVPRKGDDMRPYIKHCAEKWDWEKRVKNPRFLLLADLGLAGGMWAEDMHWGGEEIVPEPMPEFKPPHYKDPSYEDYNKGYWGMKVKNWRKALDLLVAVQSES